MSSSAFVQANDEVILHYNNENYYFTKILQSSKMYYLKKGCGVPLESFIGLPYGSYFHVSNSKLVPADPSENVFSLFGVEFDDTERDNRELKFQSNAQSLKDSEIRQLKESGVGGREIVSKIVDNSATFNSKTELSQEKYLKRKKNK
jgi:tRNA (adenine-N(1)-)-methyltransferase non-catalytic subunit